MQIRIQLLLLVSIFSLLSAQDYDNLIVKLKNEYKNIENFQTSKRNLSKVSSINIQHTKENIYRIKKQLKSLTTDLDNPVFLKNDIELDNNLDLIDFYVYDYNENYYQVFGRVKNKHKRYLEWVKLRFNLYNNGAFVGTDFTYIEMESYGSSGISPYKTSFIDTYFDKADFDSIAFQAEYDTKDGKDDILWDQILKVESVVLKPSGDYYKWQGVVKNNFSYSMTYPCIYACIMKEGRMIALDYTFLDVQNNKLSANSSAVFDSYLDLPNSYDDIKYYLGYALYSLEGNGNLPPNIPIFSKNTYNGYSRINTDFEIFVIDPNRDRIDLQIDFGNDYTSPWEGNYWSGYNADVPYSYLRAGYYSVQAKASDGNLETEWSKSATASISSSSNPVIITTDIDSAFYKKEYLHQLQSDGGIEPVSWQIRNGALPNGLVLNSDEGSITGVPLQSGLFEFSVYCKDSGIHPIADSANFQIKVNNHKPVITSSDTINTFNNTPIKYKTNAIDPDGNSISIDYLNYPDWLSVVDDTLSGITPNQILDTLFTVIASDGDLSDTMTVFISIRTKPLAIISDDIKDAVFMQAYHDTLRAGFGLPPYDWSGTKGDLPKGLKLDSSGVLSGIPHSSGDFQFMARVQDSSNPPQIDSLLLSLNVINHPPQIMSSDTITISRNKEFVYFASAIDPDGNILSYQYKNYPSWLFVTDSLLIGDVPSTAIDTSFILIASDGELMDSIKVAILINEPSSIKESKPPAHFFISDNYPNPFNPSTTIKLGLPEKVNMDIFVYDINGKLISEIYSGQLLAGEHDFTWTADNISSGIYFIYCRAEKFTKILKCTLLK